uniref:Uncharacterized protein n=1 Tax=Lepeophtheirus salmonis TaxID=72036 RepID=A0A0K2UVJ7_LEPSM
MDEFEWIWNWNKFYSNNMKCFPIYFA